MKKRKKNGSEWTLKKQLKVYSAAAAGVLALAPAADAAIHYSGNQNILVDSSNTPQNIDLNGDASVDFRFRYLENSQYPYRSLRVTGQSGASVIRHNNPIRLPSNYQIKGNLPNPSFLWGKGYELNGTTSGNIYGYFNNATGFLGVRFHTTACPVGTGNWNYGWIRYQGTTVPNSLVSGTIIDWAYEDQCNTPIAAGAEQTKTTTSVPTLNQWGMIIFMLLPGGLAARKLQKQEKES